MTHRMLRVSAFNISASLLILLLALSSVYAQTALFTRGFAPVSPPCARIRLSNVRNPNIPLDADDFRVDRLVLQEIPSGTSTVLRPSYWRVQLCGFTASFPAAVYTPASSFLSARTTVACGETRVIVEMSPRTGVRRPCYYKQSGTRQDQNVPDDPAH